MITPVRRLIVLVVFGLAALPGSVQAHGPGDTARAQPARASADPAPGAFEGPVARAACGPGSTPETGLQGRVPKAERDSGRSAQGYACNLARVGQFQGEGASWVSQSYGTCAYMSTHFPNLSGRPGVQVVDASDPSSPRRVGALTSPAMLGTWESLKVEPNRGLLAAVFASGPIGQGVLFFDVYDIKTDCTRPRLLSSGPFNAIGHEGGFSPDGRTYWSASAYESTLTAIDVADPSSPRHLLTARTGNGNHGFGFSADGNRLYMAEAGLLGSGALLAPVPLEDVLLPNGMQVLDVSDVQSRKPSPAVREISSLHWTDGAAGQHAIPITYGGRPHVVFVDELLSGAARIIDIGDERAPRIVSKLKLEIQMAENAALRRSDTTNPVLFGYDAHYCEVDRQTDPTTLACGYFASGVRVFDIRDPLKPAEIAYYNPPAQVGKTASLQSSEHAATVGDLTTDWCSSPPRFVGQTLWVTCQDNGFQVLRFTNGAYPLPTGTGAALLPTPRRCLSRRDFVIRLPRQMRTATVTVNGKRVRVVLRAGRLRARVNLRKLPRTTVKVRVVGRTRGGQRVFDERAYRTCRRATER